MSSASWSRGSFCRGLIPLPAEDGRGCGTGLAAPLRHEKWQNTGKFHETNIFLLRLFTLNSYHLVYNCNQILRRGAGLGDFANPRRLEPCGSVPAQAGTSGAGKTEMDGLQK